VEDLGRGLKSAAQNIEKETSKIGSAIEETFKTITEKSLEKNLHRNQPRTKNSTPEDFNRITMPLCRPERNLGILSAHSRKLAPFRASENIVGQSTNPPVQLKFAFSLASPPGKSLRSMNLPVFSRNDLFMHRIHPDHTPSKQRSAQVLLFSPGYRVNCAFIKDFTSDQEHRMGFGSDRNRHGDPIGDRRCHGGLFNKHHIDRTIRLAASIS
jgi:hypothetical protein